MADIHQPHDRLFRSVFSDAGEAAGLLQTALPATLRNSFDWTTLTLVDGTFIDEDLQGSQSDLLYQVEHTESGQAVSVYMLFEHQSSPDPWMPFRLLRYCCRIWEAERRDDPGKSELRPIVPVVFYQGARSWNHSTEFAHLFPEAVRSLPWVPRFAHELLDQTTLEPDAVGGGIKGRIAQLLTMVAFNRHLDAALEVTAGLLLLLRQAGGGVDERRQFYLYLLATQDLDVVQRLREALRRRGFEEEDEIMTYAQQLLAEGEAKGRAEGEAKGRVEGEAKGRAETQVEVVEGLLRTGLAWDVIEAATGLTEVGFQALKARMAGSDS